MELSPAKPPEILYHGTAQQFAASIEAQGLLSQGRLYVHLSPNAETAEKVGRRHGEPVIYLVDAGQMHRDGHPFYLPANGVWQTKAVPARYLKNQRNGKKTEQSQRFRWKEKESLALFSKIWYNDQDILY